MSEMTPATAWASFAELRARCRTAPVVVDDVLPHLAPAMAREILALAGREASTPSKNVGGWKSYEAVLGRAGAFAELRAIVVERFLRGRELSASWAMVNRAGSEHPRHQHRIALLSGVYYVAAGDPPVDTIFEVPAHIRLLVDGHPATTLDGLSLELRVAPRPGRLVFFDGETWHRVPRYDGAEPRITIAFDVRR